MKKTCYCYTFYNENHTYVPVHNCNKKILFIKKYLRLLRVFTDFSIFLVAFLNTNTATTRQLIGKASTLEAEWWQVCGEAWVRGQRKMSQVLVAFGLLDFTMLRPVLARRAFLNLWTVYLFNFPTFFFFGPWPTADRGAHLYTRRPSSIQLRVLPSRRIQVY